MATGRMLRNQISISEQVNSLSVEAALLFTWIISHADDFGRLRAEPKKIKALVVPINEHYTVEIVEKCLISMHEIGLIQLYQVNSKSYLQLIEFDAHQPGLKRRTKSKFPGPEFSDLHEFPGISKNCMKMQEIPENFGNSLKFQKKQQILAEQEQEQEQEYISLPKRARGRVKKNKTKIPEDFQVSQQIVLKAKEKGWPDPYDHIDEFKSYWKGAGETKADWEATFENCLIKAASFKKKQKEKSNEKVQPSYGTASRREQNRNYFKRALAKAIQQPSHHSAPTDSTHLTHDVDETEPALINGHHR